jgi:hypothetical protein
VSVRETIPDRDGLLLQLAAFAGNEPADSFIEIRPLKPVGRQEFIPVRDLTAAVERVLALREHHQVFIGASPRIMPGGKAEHVARCWALLCDCDTPESVERLRAFRPLPSIVAETSPGKMHAYWPLKVPLENGAARSAKRQLARALSADEAVVDPARVMRAVGSVHCKDKPSIVHCIRCELDVFTASDVVGHLPPIPAAPAPARPRAESTDALDTIASTTYVPLLSGHEVGGDGKTLCPFHEERTPSFQAYDEPARGWNCFGCGLGGSIIDFGAALYGISPRGRGFHDIRRRLASDLGANA